MPTYKNNAAIWVKKTKNGDTFFSFKADRDIKQGESLAFFKNNRKDKETQPDFRSYEKIEDQQVGEDVNPDDLPF